VLHDIVEERDHTGISAGDLLALGFDPRIVAWVVRLSSRPPGVSYQENILALASEPDLPPILVKLADNDHNMAPERIAALPPEERSILRRYERSSPVLAGEVARRTGAEIALPLRARAAEPGSVPATGP
jgi:(p)ppGpp synthase/HD superfamily hydrolase